MQIGRIGLLVGVLLCVVAALAAKLKYIAAKAAPTVVLDKLVRL